VRHADVEFALKVIFAAINNNMMFGPVYFCKQWLQFCVFPIGQMKYSNIPYIFFKKALDAGKFNCKSAASFSTTDFLPPKCCRQTQMARVR
jgi:hypothetical protein